MSGNGAKNWKTEQTPMIMTALASPAHQEQMYAACIQELVLENDANIENLSSALELSIRTVHNICP
jgi:hypothetical protein